MKKFILPIFLIGMVGCGSGFLGLEDYQRDILSVLIGQNSGSDGLDCWDKSSDGVCDASEDWSGPNGEPDGICDAWDCQGAPGVQGERGRQGRGVKNNTLLEEDCTTLCHCNKDKCHTLNIAEPAVTTLCHCNKDKCHTLNIAEPAVKAHLAHGDICGACEE